MIKTEFSKVNDLFLAYPKGFEDISDKVVSFYQKLIGIIPNDIRQFIIVNNEPAGKEIKALYPKKNIEVIEVRNFNEIWLRDIMGFNTGINRIYRPIFKPDYYNEIYDQEYLDLIETQVKQIFMRSIGAEVVELPLILDGGNLITNGEIGFVTDKVIKQNPEMAIYIGKILHDYLGIETIMVKSNKKDKLAHTDGYMNFLNKETLCISQYPDIDFLKDDRIYANELYKMAKSLDLKIIPIYDRPVAEKAVEGSEPLNSKPGNCLYSARGVFVNFLILNDTIILPEYTIPSYKKEMDYNAVNRQALTNMGYNVIMINCDDLARLGGSLHCISFTN
jgi:agmatine/peptidylarginine deiminase